MSVEEIIKYYVPKQNKTLKTSKKQEFASQPTFVYHGNEFQTQPLEQPIQIFGQ
jgi:hypothetical protein